MKKNVIELYRNEFAGEIECNNKKYGRVEYSLRPLAGATIDIEKWVVPMDAPQNMADWGHVDTMMDEGKVFPVISDKYGETYDLISLAEVERQEKALADFEKMYGLPELQGTEDEVEDARKYRKILTRVFFDALTKSPENEVWEDVKEFKKKVMNNSAKFWIEIWNNHDKRAKFIEKRQSAMNWKVIS